MTAGTSRLVVQDSVGVAQFRLALAVAVLIFAVYSGFRSDQDYKVPALLTGIISLPLAVIYLKQALHPQPILIIDAGGIWASGAEGVIWEELRAYRSSYCPSLESATEDIFVFIQQNGQEIKVDLDSADTDSAAIRRFLAQLTLNPPLRDLGHQRC